MTRLDGACSLPQQTPLLSANLACADKCSDECSAGATAASFVFMAYLLFMAIVNSGTDSIVVQGKPYFYRPPSPDGVSVHLTTGHCPFLDMHGSGLAGETMAGGLDQNNTKKICLMRNIHGRRQLSKA
jgi:hypothetical protein